MSSIFSKLAGTERHREFIERLELGETSIDPGRKASSVSGMTDMGLGLRISCACRGGAAGIGGDALIAIAGPDAPLRSIRFVCRSCGGNAIAMPENLDRLQALPPAAEYFTHVVKSIVEIPVSKPGTSGSGRDRNRDIETPTKADAAEVPVKKKRGRPPKAASAPVSDAPSGKTSASGSSKRGRKPKDNTPATDKPARKRGRPPKQKPETSRQDAATAPRRGRPPKSAHAPAAPKPKDKPARKRGRPPKAAKNDVKPTPEKPGRKTVRQRGKASGKKK